jgi:hypothetical protein
MTNHTPAPWAIQTCNENGPFLDSFFLSANVPTWDGNTADRIVCRFPTGTGQFSDTGRENLANAHLIAAAPDLLSALNLLLDKLHAHAPGLITDRHTESAITKAEMAIAKARGAE